MEIIKLNIIPSGVNPTCHASQYDEGRVIRIELYEGLTPFTLQANDEVSLAVRKPDNKIVTMLVENTEDTYVEIVTTKQSCAIVGSNLCELTIKRGAVVIGTLNFNMLVERDPIADGDPSESEINDLQERVYECVEVALEDLYDGTSVAFDSEPNAEHDAPYCVTSAGVYQVKTALETAISGKADASALSNYYTKTQVDNALATKADATTLLNYYLKTETYSKNEVNNLFNGLAIDDLSDVDIDEQTLAAGQGIVYDAETGKFVNGEVSSTSTLEALTDTQISDKQDNDSVVYNSTLAKWINKAMTKELNQAAYDNLSQAEQENGTVYYVPDATSTPITAEDITYSGSTNVKQAIDAKANSADVYTKTEIDTALSGKVGSDFITTQAFELNNLSVANNTDYNYSIDITKTGYTPIGVVQSGFVGNYGTRFHFAKQFIVGNQIDLTFRANAESFSTTGFAVNVTILYKKS